MKSVTEKSTKKELWEAYQALKEQSQNASLPFQEVRKKQEEEKDKAFSTNARERKGSALHGKLEALGELEDTINSIISHFKGESALFQKHLADEREEWKREREQEEESRKRERDAYAYRVKMERRIEEDEYSWALKEKERKHEERFSEREGELAEREAHIVAQEEEVGALRKQAALFPDELRKKIHDIEQKTRKDAEEAARAKAELLAKDTEAERELAKLKLHNADDIIKRQAAHIASLEKQVAYAAQKVQELAVSVISSRSSPIDTTGTTGVESKEQKREK